MYGVPVIDFDGVCDEFDGFCEFFKTLVLLAHDDTFDVLVVIVFIDKFPFTRSHNDDKKRDLPSSRKKRDAPVF